MSKKNKKQDAPKGDPQHLWDSAEDDRDGEHFDAKYAEWEERNWGTWLPKQLTFPFNTVRQEEMDDYRPGHDPGPFGVGQQLKVLKIQYSEHFESISALVEAGNHKQGEVPLADLEVTPKSDPNYWPVREYTVWTANS